MAERAMSPWAVSARVRGMGVAVIASRWGRGLFLFCSLALCPTPNLQSPGHFVRPAALGESLLHWENLAASGTAASVLGNPDASLRTYGSQQMQVNVGRSRRASVPALPRCCLPRCAAPYLTAEAHASSQQNHHQHQQITAFATAQPNRQGLAQDATASDTTAQHSTAHTPPSRNYGGGWGYLCCSSMTATPSFLNSRASVMSACVPTMTLMLPSARPA